MGLPPASFTVVVSPFDEDDSDFRSLKTRVSSSEYVKTSASNKASAVVELYRGGERELPSPATRGVVIGADTVVELGGKVLEKPKSEEEARGMLRSLSGAKHSVRTGVSLQTFNLKTGNSTSVSFCSTSSVKFRVLSESDITAYITTGEPMDKAGSYGIQGIGGVFVEGIEGCFFNVMGLPMGEVAVRVGEIIQKEEV